MNQIGPIPVSRLKDEAQRIFDALEDGAEVLISRHGNVVAAIEPASVPLHQRSLAAFAVGDSAVAELSATQIGQGSPSEAVSRASQGEPILVTRNGKVLGVLGAPQPSTDLDSSREQERVLAALEAQGADVTPEQFEQASVLAAAAAAPVTGTGASSRADSAFATEAVITDALLVRGLALEAESDLPGAADTFRATIDRYREHPDVHVRTRVAQSMVELARVYIREGKADEAIPLTETAVEMLDGRVHPPQASFLSSFLAVRPQGA